MNNLKTFLMCPLWLFALHSMGQNAIDFTVKTPQKGTYYCNFWMLPTTYANDSCASYDVLLNNRQIGTLSAKQGGWQSLCLDGKPCISLEKGDNVLSVVGRGCDVPEVQQVKLAESHEAARINSEPYDCYLDRAKHGADESSLYNVDGNVALLSTNGDNILIANKEVPLKYSFYKIFELKEGQAISVYTISQDKHSVDVFYLGKKHTLLQASLETQSVANVSTIISGPIRPDYKLLYVKASTDEMQGLSWKRNSTDEDGKQETSLIIDIPKSGYYMVKLRSSEPFHLGTADVQFGRCEAGSNSFTVWQDAGLFTDVPMYYSNVSCVIPSNVQDISVITDSEGKKDCDPMLFVEGNAGHRIVGYSDDASSNERTVYGLSPLDACLGQIYKVSTTDVHVSSYSSLLPESTCEVRCGLNSELEEAPAPMRAALNMGECAMDEIQKNDFAECEWRSLSVYDSTGKQVMSIGQNRPSDGLDILPKGLYIVKATLSNGGYKVYKVNVK